MELIIEEALEIEDFTIYLKIFKLHKSYLVLLSDNHDMGIGNVTLASPPSIEGLKSTAASYKLFGVGDSLLNTIIAEKISFLLRAPALTLIFLNQKIEDTEVAKPIISRLDALISQFIEKNSQ